MTKTLRKQSLDPKVEILLKADPYLKPYTEVIRKRLHKIEKMHARLTQKKKSLAEFALGHLHYGLHRVASGWILREWAPNASAVYLIGDMTDWKELSSYRFQRINTYGDWELCMPQNAVSHGQHYCLRLHWPGGQGNRIPAYCQRVVQDPETLIFSAQIWNPQPPFEWRHPRAQGKKDGLLIYEAHIGMAQEEPEIGTYTAFAENIIPRIVRAGYNTIQIMALPEHPYYGSFGYQVSSFFAASSRFGTPEELKLLVDTAHDAGLKVIMDLIHSHSVSNENEGLSRFDGTTYQYFHAGARGRHPAWDSRCFDYAKPQVLHFLLSNCRFWLDAFHLDGFRFDGITSMLYKHHGLGHAFTNYDDYFDDSLDEDALVYLALANRLIHEIEPTAITIAEDVSGLPGLAVPVSRGGIGFDYRFAMGVPDYWIKLTKDNRDEDWPMGDLWYELTNRRHDEKTISYAESHDQALVGDQTLIFRLMGDSMYAHMAKTEAHLKIDRGVALHKMIRLLTLSTADQGYLNFMGNEFGHPEWIDFPRPGNNWSYHYARRQWHLVDDPELKYSQLACFDRDMIGLAKRYAIFNSHTSLVHEHDDDKVLAFCRGQLIFIFNFHSHNSYPDYFLHMAKGNYKWVFDTDKNRYGGHGRLNDARECVFESCIQKKISTEGLHIYLPCRSAIVITPYNNYL